jgi:hypothetical protein
MSVVKAVLDVRTGQSIFQARTWREANAGGKDQNATTSYMPQEATLSSIAAKYTRYPKQ